MPFRSLVQHSNHSLWIHVSFLTPSAQLNCSSIVDGQIFDWKDFFEQHWCDFQHLIIQSYHNSAGVVIANTTNPLHPSILLPVQDGVYADCRKADVRFVRVSSVINFAPLAIGHLVPGPTILRSQYYIELPQTTRVLTNGVGVAYNLTTWHGVDDLSTLSVANIRLLILDVVIQSGPIALLQADFNLGEANIDSNGLVETIHAKILKLGFNHILLIPSLLNYTPITATSPMLRWTTFSNLVSAPIASL